ncbi:MAG: IPT/TIG domain-containing protein [Planctomycetota bacterium]
MTFTSITPKLGPTTGGTTVKIVGTNFASITSVKLGGVALTSLVVTATQITGKTGAHAAGAADVIVRSTTNGTVTKKKGFTYGVTVKAIAPASGPIAGGTAVTITGANFLNVTSVKVGGVELTNRVVTATKITGKTGAHAAGRVDVVVASSTQGTGAKVGAFTYTAGLSFATSVKPILETKCTLCHTQGGPSSFAPFTDVAGGPAIYTRIRNGVSTFNTPATYVVPGDALQSLVVVKTQTGGAMNDKLTATEAQTIKDWVLQGANP